MIIGSISENKNIEKRISITPDIAKKYIASGFQILFLGLLGEYINIILLHVRNLPLVVEKERFNF